MSDNFWYGYMAGESQARANRAAGDLAATVSESFRNLGREPQANIADQLAQAQRSAVMFRAALCGVAASISALPPAARGEMEKAMAQHFAEAFAGAAHEHGYRVNPADPQIAASRQSILRRGKR
jgi:hypothetical protein